MKITKSIITLLISLTLNAMDKEILFSIQLNIHNNTSDDYKIIQWPDYKEEMLTTGAISEFAIDYTQLNHAEDGKFIFKIKGTKIHSPEIQFEISKSINNLHEIIFYLEDIATGNLPPQKVATHLEKRSAAIYIDLYLKGTMLKNTYFEVSNTVKASKPEKHIFKKAFKKIF